MKTKVKALAAALTLLAAGQANAAINDDGSLAGAIGNGSGELFLSVIDRGGNNPESYVRDLGLTANQFVNPDSSPNNSVGSFSFSADSGLQGLLSNAATNGGTIEWDIAAAYNGAIGPSAPYGYLTTSPSALNGSNIPTGFTGISTALTKLGTYVQAVNSASAAAGGSATNDYAANDSVVVDSASSAYYDHNLWAAGPATSGTAEGPIGSPLGFYFVYENPNIFNDGNDQSFASAAFNNYWTLASNGDLTFAPAPTPLPPAVWLLGSALVGLVGVGRRRSNVAV